MKKKAMWLGIGGGTLAVALAAAAAMAGGVRTAKVDAASDWTHFAGVDPTETTAGIREYWHSCDAEAKIVYERPSSGTVEEGVWDDAKKNVILSNSSDERYLPSFNDVKTALGDHDGTMPYDGSFVDKAYGMMEHYSDAAKTALAAEKDVASVYTVYHTYYGIAMSAHSDTAGGLASAAYALPNSEKTDTKFGPMREINLSAVTAGNKPSGLTVGGNGRIYDNLKIVADSHGDTSDASALVMYLKGPEYDTGSEFTTKGADLAHPSTDPTEKAFVSFADSSNTTVKVQASLVEQLEKNYYAVWFTSLDGLADFGSTTNFTVGFEGGWLAQDWELSDFYFVKSSRFQGAGTMMANKMDYTQAFNNWDSGYAQTTSVDHPLYGEKVLNGKYYDPTMTVRLGVLGTAGTDQKMGVVPDATSFTKAYIWFHTSVPATIVNNSFGTGGSGGTGMVSFFKGSAAATGANISISTGWNKLYLSDDAIAKIKTAEASTNLNLFMTFSGDSTLLPSDAHYTCAFRISSIYGEN